MRLGHAVAVALLTLLVLAALAAWYMLQPALLAQHWRESLHEVPEEQAVAYLRRAARLGTDGLPVLAAALASPRREMSAAAVLVIEEQLDEWQRLPGHRASTRLVSLIKAVSARVERFDRHGLEFAADLAERALAWPTDSSVTDRAKLLTACDQMLEAARAVAEGPRETTDSPSEAHSLALAEAKEPTPDDAEAADEAVRSVASKEGSGISFAVEVTDADPPAAAAESPPAIRIVPTPQRVGRNDEEQRATDSEPTGRPDEVGSEDPSDEGNDAGTVGPPARLTAPVATANRRTLLSPERTQDFPGPPRIYRLFVELHAEDPARAAAAREQLDRLGIRPAYLEVGWHLTDPDPRVRLDMARRLPRLSDIDAQGWLVWLCHDPDSEVRRTALTMLATVNDPRVRRRVVEFADRDADPQIRRLADRLRESKVR